MLTVILLFFARPPAVLLLLGTSRIPRAERILLAWAGMRGAVPILLASLALANGVDDAHRIYGLVFVVVAASVCVQGMTLPPVTAALGVTREQEAGR